MLKTQAKPPFSCKIRWGEQYKLAFELEKGQQVSEEQLLLSWEPLLKFLEAQYLDFITIRKEAAIKISSKITQTTALNSVIQFD